MVLQGRVVAVSQDAGITAHSYACCQQVLHRCMPYGLWLRVATHIIHTLKILLSTGLLDAIHSRVARAMLGHAHWYGCIQELFLSPVPL